MNPFRKARTAVYEPAPGDSDETRINWLYEGAAKFGEVTLWRNSKYSPGWTVTIKNRDELRGDSPYLQEALRFAIAKAEAVANVGGRKT